MKQRRNTLYILAREELRKLDPNLGKFNLARLTGAAIDAGLVWLNARGQVMFARGDQE